MAGSYFGTGGVARKVKTMYFGVNGVACKVKKVYLGVGDKARLTYKAAKDVVYYGTATPLRQAAYGLKATTAGNKYALFAGGEYARYGYSKNVDAYSETLVRSSPANLKSSKYNHSAASVGDYALFAAGQDSDKAYLSSLDSYSSTLTYMNLSNLSKPRGSISTATVGKYALFAGGYSNPTRYSTVDTCSDTLSRGTATVLSAAKTTTGCSVEKYALFAGGFSTVGSTAAVDAYNEVLTRSTPAPLSKARSCSSSKVGKYALFFGGNDAAINYTIIESYDEMLTRKTVTTINLDTTAVGRTNLGEYALIGSYTQQDVIDIVDDRLTKANSVKLSVSRGAAATTVGEYALFGGSGAYGTDSAVVDVFTIK